MHYASHYHTGVKLWGWYTGALYSRHHWDPAVCPIQRGVPNSEVVVLISEVFRVSNAPGAVLRFNLL